MTSQSTPLRDDAPSQIPVAKPSIGKHWKSRLAARDPQLHIHLIGIGGTGLGPIAHVLLEQGFRISGSDLAPSERIDAIEAAGATIYIGQRPENLHPNSGSPPDLVLISSAIAAENPERQEAERLEIEVVTRRNFLRPFLAGRRVVAVAGTHGKSTTTAMIVQILRHAQIDAGFIIGSTLPGLGNASAGSDPLFVIEADEYDHAFLGLSPEAAVITSVEWDHPDCFPSVASFRRAFMQFSDLVDRNGFIVSCADDPGAEAVRSYAPTRGTWITYGLSAAADLCALDPVFTPDGELESSLRWWNAPVGTLRLQVAGLHNVRNALAALSIAHYCDVPVPVGLEALARFGGISRRFELKAEIGGVLVIDDYAHHPTAVQATLSAARARYPHRRIRAIFQPHTFSRTAQFIREMALSFEDADRVYITDIYGSRERDEQTIHARDLVAKSDHKAIRFSGGVEETARIVASDSEPGDLVITLGAGSSDKIGHLILEHLRSE